MAGEAVNEEAKKEEEASVKVADNKPKLEKDKEEKQEKVAEEEAITEKLKATKMVNEEEKEEGKVAMKEEDVKMSAEPKTGVSFPVKLSDGKQLNSMGVRKKKILALGINIYAFGMYADNGKLMDLLKEKFGKAPPKPTKELYESVINGDIGMVVRLIIVYGGLTMSLVRKGFDEGLGASIKKLTGGQKNDALVNKVMGEAKDSIKLSPGSVIEITRFPGHILQTTVKDEVVSKVESELLCRAYFHMYLGDDPFDKEAKERFGASLLSLF